MDPGNWQHESTYVKEGSLWSVGLWLRRERFIQLIIVILTVHFLVHDSSNFFFFLIEIHYFQKMENEHSLHLLVYPP